MLTKLERMGLTDLRAHIIYEDIWTPEDIQHNYRSNRGAIYGVVADKKKNKGFKFPKQSEYFDNLCGRLCKSRWRYANGNVKWHASCRQN